MSDILKHWYVEMYEKQETQTNDVELLISIIGKEMPQNILEVCCGTGRIFVPLAKLGHRMTGFDLDEFMLAKLYEKAKGLDNVRVYSADAITSEWGQDFDVVILGGNILINIVTQIDYKVAQQLFIQKAYSALRPGGCLFMDTGCFIHPERFFRQPGERVHWEGTDDVGTSGRYLTLDGTYDGENRICRFRRRTELVTSTGEELCIHAESYKHIPSTAQMDEWLTTTGFTISKRYGDYSGNPIGEETHRAIYWAQKPQPEGVPSSGGSWMEGHQLVTL